MSRATLVTVRSSIARTSFISARVCSVSRKSKWLQFRNFPRRVLSCARRRPRTLMPDFLSKSLSSSTGFPAGNCTGQRTFDDDSVYKGDLQVFCENDLINGDAVHSRVSMLTRNVPAPALTPLFYSDRAHLSFSLLKQSPDFSC